MNPEGTWWRRGTESAVVCLSVCLASLLRHLREKRHASWYIIQLQSQFCMPNQKNQPTKRETCHAAPCIGTRSVGPLTDIRILRCQPNC